jgi:hypothetical protein
MFGLDHLCSGGTTLEGTIRLYGELDPDLALWVSRSDHIERPPDALGPDPDPKVGRPDSNLYGDLNHVLLLHSPASSVADIALPAREH